MTPQVISLSALGSTAWIPVDYIQNPYNIDIAIVLSNTPNLTCKVEYTLDDIFNPAITPTAFTHSTLTGLTSNATGNITSPVRAIRLTVTAWTSGTATMTALQGVVNPVIYTPNPITLYQSGIPFWIPPGDGGSNGLIFTGTRGVFSLSAEAPLENAWIYLAGGGYIYLPAGAGGLVSGGWYWCVMTGATAGEVYAETYSGFGRPARVTSPTALPNLTATRIIQLISEISAVSFILPGGSLGASGVYVSKARIVSNSSAGTKNLRLSISNATPTTRLWSMARTSANLVGNLQFTGFAHGNRLIKSTSNSGSSEVWDNGSFSSVTTGDVLSVDLTVDQTITMSGQLPANTDSLLFVPGQFVIQYGE